MFGGGCEGGGVVVVLPYPHGCEKDHIAPQLCQKEEGHGRKMGGGCVFAFHGLALGA